MGKCGVAPAALRRALSLARFPGQAGWRTRPWRDIPAEMKASLIILLAALVLSPAIAHAADGNRLKTMPHGVYECAFPGDAGGPVWEPITEAGFVISHTSAYRTEEGRGTYLLKGKDLVITSGPKRGERYRRTGDAELKLIDDVGNLTGLICVKVASRH